MVETQTPTRLQIAHPAQVRPVARNPLWSMALHTPLATLASFKFTLLQASLWGLMIVPTVLASLYYGLIASDQFIAEARLLVRGGQSSVSTKWDVMLQSLGVQTGAPEAYAVADYISSRDAMQALQQSLDLKHMLGDRQADLLSRWPRPWENPTQESLFGAYQSHVHVRQDRHSGILTLRVTAFHPQDSQAIAHALMSLAEARVNQINTRARDDRMDASAHRLAMAQARLQGAQDEISTYQAKVQSLDPLRDASASLQVAAKLSGQRSALAAQLAQGEQAAPQNPTLVPLRAEIQALDRQIAAAHMGEGADISARADTPLPTQMAQFTRLKLTKDLAEQTVREATFALRLAQQQAERAQIYVEPVVTPYRPDEALEPQRWRSIGKVLAAGFLAHALVWVMVTGAQEHGH